MILKKKAWTLVWGIKIEFIETQTHLEYDFYLKIVGNTGRSDGQMELVGSMVAMVAEVFLLLLWLTINQKFSVMEDILGSELKGIFDERAAFAVVAASGVDAIIYFSRRFAYLVTVPLAVPILIKDLGRDNRIDMAA